MLAAALVAVSLPTGARAAGEAVDLIDRHWHHDGIFGSFDRPALQRGFQVYREVCASCHGLKFMAFRNLMDVGFSEEQAAAEWIARFAHEFPR